jgi:hypothetical protein
MLLLNAGVSWKADVAAPLHAADVHRVLTIVYEYMGEALFAGDAPATETPQCVAETVDLSQLPVPLPGVFGNLRGVVRDRWGAEYVWSGGKVPLAVRLWSLSEEHQRGDVTLPFRPLGRAD